MKKTIKHKLASNLLVCSSILVLSTPLVTQNIAATQVLADTVHTEATAETSETVSEQQESTVGQMVASEESGSSESSIVENTTASSSIINETAESTSSSDYSTSQSVSSSKSDESSVSSSTVESQTEVPRQTAAIGPATIQVHSVNARGENLKPVRVYTTVVNESERHPKLSTYPLSVEGYAFKSVNVDEVEPDGRVNVSFPNVGETLDIIYVYEPIPQNIVVNFIDDDANSAVLKSVSLDGIFQEVAGYTTVDDINALKEKGYTVISDQTNGEKLTFGSTSPTAYEVHLKHEIEETEETKIVERTIHYVYEDGGAKAADDKKEALVFTRSATTDTVTGISTYGDWMAINNDTTFDEVKSPEIANYSPDKETISEVAGITAESENLEETVTYSKDEEAITETKDVTRTIHYNYQDGTEAAADNKDKVTFTRTKTTDARTGEIFYSEWKAKDDDTTFDEVISPSIDGYTADPKLISEVTVKVGDKDIELNVTYNKETTISSDETTETPVTETKNSTTASTEASNKQTIILPEGSQEDRNAATVTSKNTTAIKTLPSTGEKVKTSPIWVGSFIAVVAALLNVFVNRSKKAK